MSRRRCPPEKRGCTNLPQLPVPPSAGGAPDGDCSVASCHERPTQFPTYQSQPAEIWRFRCVRSKVLTYYFMNDQNQKELLAGDDLFWKSDEFRSLNPAARLTIWRERCIDAQHPKRKNQSTAPVQETDDERSQRLQCESHWRWAEMLRQQGEAERQPAAAAEIESSTNPSVFEITRESLRRIKDPLKRLQRARELGIE